MKLSSIAAISICFLAFSRFALSAETPDEVAALVGLCRAHSESLLNGVAHGVYEDYQLGRATGGITPQGQYLKKTIEFEYAFDSVARCFRVDSRCLAQVNVAAEGGTPSETLLAEHSGGAYQNNQRMNLYHDSMKVSIQAALWSDRVCRVEMGVAFRAPYTSIPEPDYMLVDPSFTMHYVDFIRASELRATERDNYYRRLSVEPGAGELSGIVIRQDKLALTDLSVRPGDPSSDKGEYVYDLVTQKFWIHPEYGYLQRFQKSQKAYPRVEFEDAFVLEGKSFRVTRSIPEPVLSVDVAITYDSTAKPFFPRQILVREFIGLPSAPSPVISHQRRIRFDSARLNREEFAVAEFFLYPEFQGTILVAQDGSRGVPVLPEQYLTLFSDLTLDNSRVVIRNPWLFSGETQ